MKVLIVEDNECQWNPGISLKHDNGGAWPTKAELIASNKRLIILAADGIDLTGSEYANNKGYVAWKGYITPKKKGAKTNTTHLAARKIVF